MKAALVVVGGKASKDKIALKLPTIIGRSKDATLTIAHPLVSRQHCRLSEVDGLLMLHDLGSLNGTELGGQRIREAPLPPGAEFTVGPLTFRVEYTYQGDLSKLPAIVYSDQQKPAGAGISAGLQELPSFEPFDESAPFDPLTVDFNQAPAAPATDTSFFDDIIGEPAADSGRGENKPSESMAEQPAASDDDSLLGFLSSGGVEEPEPEPTPPPPAQAKKAASKPAATPASEPEAEIENELPALSEPEAAEESSDETDVSEEAVAEAEVAEESEAAAEAAEEEEFEPTFPAEEEPGETEAVGESFMDFLSEPEAEPKAAEEEPAETDDAEEPEPEAEAVEEPEAESDAAEKEEFEPATHTEEASDEAEVAEGSFGADWLDGPEAVPKISRPSAASKPTAKKKTKGSWFSGLFGWRKKKKAEPEPEEELEAEEESNDEDLDAEPIAEESAGEESDSEEPSGEESEPEKAVEETAFDEGAMFGAAESEEGEESESDETNDSEFDDFLKGLR